MKIRDATSSDLGAMYAVDPMATEDGSRRQHIRDWVATGQTIVAVVDGEICGYAALEYSFFGCGFLAMLIVRKENRRKGVATALVTQLQQRCETEKLFTSTNESNKAMQALMQAMSYEPSGIVYNLDEGDPELFYLKRIEPKR